MNRPRSFEEVQTYLNQLEGRLAKLENQNIDLHQRRIINAADAVDKQDYVTLVQLNSLNTKSTVTTSSPFTKQTLAAYASDTETVAYTGLTNAVVGSVYAKLADLNILRLAYENLRLAYEDLRTKLKDTNLLK